MSRVSRLRAWWRSLHMMECPVCGEPVSFRYKDRDLPASRAAHYRLHGQRAWRDALAPWRGR
jgi:hypothetical protein